MSGIAGGAPEVFFTFQSTHAAMDAEKRLAQAGIAVRVMPLPDELGAGCGLCLRVDERQAAAAADVMRAGAGFQAAYTLERADGKARYTECGL